MRYDITQLTDLLKAENFNPTNFIEIGSRDGHDTHYICNYWNLSAPNCFIIEAHPGCYEFIKNTYPYYNTMNVAASNVTGVITFNAGIIGKESNIGISSVLQRKIDTFLSEPVELDAWRMDDVMNYFQIEKFDFMKIDVEGFGLEVLLGFGEKLKNTQYIQIELEVSQVWENQSYYKDVVDYLASLGFEVLQDIKICELQHDVLFKNTRLIYEESN